MVTWVNQVFNKSLSSKSSKIPFRDGKPWPRNLLPSCYLESKLFPKRHSLLQTETAWKDLCLTPEQRFLRSAAKPSTAPGKRSDTNIDTLLLVRAHPRPPPWTPWRQDLPSRLLSHFKLRQVTSPAHQSGGYRTWGCWDMVIWSANEQFDALLKGCFIELPLSSMFSQSATHIQESKRNPAWVISDLRALLWRSDSQGTDLAVTCSQVSQSHLGGTFGISYHPT